MQKELEPLEKHELLCAVNNWTFEQSFELYKWAKSWKQLRSIRQNLSYDQWVVIKDSYKDGSVFCNKVSCILPKLDKSILSKMDNVKYGIDKAEPALLEEFTKHDFLKQFDKKEGWRLFMDGKLQENRGKFGFENEKGYMAAMMSAFTKMLESLKEPLTVESYKQLHDYAIDNVYDAGQRRMEPGFRNSQIDGEGFGVDGSTMTKKGLEELEFKYKNRFENPVGYVLYTDPSTLTLDNPTKRQEILLKPLVTSQCERFVGIVIDLYNKEIKTCSQNNDEIIKCIAKCCQDLDQIHVFVDGNIRTIAFLVLNKLLLQNKLSPTILEEPNIFDCTDLDSLVKAIKKGQELFSQYCVN